MINSNPSVVEEKVTKPFEDTVPIFVRWEIIVTDSEIREVEEGVSMGIPSVSKWSKNRN